MEEKIPYYTKDYPTKSGFMEAVRFGVRIRVFQRPPFTGSFAINPEDPANSDDGSIMMKPGDSIVVAHNENRWFVRVTLNLNGDKYITE
jgi:hypothetical protein